MSLSDEGYGLAELTEIDPAVYAGFNCGKPHLDDFLVNRAHFFHSSRLGHVWLVLHADSPGPVGFFTLHNDSLELTSMEETDLGLSDHAGLKRFPAINIGRLAVDAKFQKTGASNKVMRMALDLIGGRAVRTSPSAARIVVVDADNDEGVLKYYGRHGFEQSAWADKQAAHQGGRAKRPTIKMLRDILMPW